jgi:hypothetical protein
MRTFSTSKHFFNFNRVGTEAGFISTTLFFMFRNTSVEWFDWGDNEPNNFGGQVRGHVLSSLPVGGHAPHCK